MLREDQSKKIGGPGLTVEVYYQNILFLFNYFHLIEIKLNVLD